MKLGELRGAIRKTKGAPFVKLCAAGQTLSLYLQKTPLLEALDQAFPGGKATETGLDFDAETGHLEGFDGITGDAQEAVSKAVLEQLGETDLLDDEPEEVEVSTSPLDEDDDLLV